MSRFVAVAVADDAQVALAARLAPLAEVPVTWTRPDGWHVTLAFCGGIGDDELPALERVVAEVVESSAPATVGLALGGTDVFDGGALVVEVHDQPCGTLAALGGRLQSAIAAAGLEVRVRDVRPHLTVARARAGSDALRRASRAAEQALVGEAITWRAAELTLFRSVPGQGSARYAVEARIPFP